MGKTMMTCREVTDLVTEYLERRLGWQDRLRFQLHIGMCRHCRAYLRQMKATVRLSGKVPSEAPPPEVEAELVDRFKDWFEK